MGLDGGWMWDMRGLLLGRDYTTVGRDGEFAACDWVKIGFARLAAERRKCK